MTDSPRVRAPLDPNERPLLDKLLQIRTRLELLKSDKSCYVKSDDVLSIYQDLINQVDSLNDIRAHKRGEQNRGERMVLGFSTPELTNIEQWIPSSTTASSLYRSLL